MFEQKRIKGESYLFLQACSLLTVSDRLIGFTLLNKRTFSPSYQSSDGRGSESSQSFSPERGGRGGKSSRKGRRARGSSDSEESDVADMNTKTKKSGQDKKSQEEPKKGKESAMMVL